MSGFPDKEPGRARGMSPSYEAAVFVLRRLRYKDIGQYIHPTWIDSARLYEDSRPWSSTEKMLVGFALDLYEDPGIPAQSMDDLICYLDEENWSVVIKAMDLKRSRLRGGARVEETQ